MLSTPIKQWHINKAPFTGVCLAATRPPAYPPQPKSQLQSRLIMLNQMRKGVGSIFAKIFIGLLVLSFAVWGVGGIFNNDPNGEAVATVGKYEILVVEFGQAYSRELQSWSQRLGRPLDPDEARNFQLPDSALRGLLSRALLLEVANGYGIAISDQMIADDIRSNPNFFRGERFDELTYDQILFNNGLSRQAYEQSLRRDLSRDLLMTSIIAGQYAPDRMIEPVYRYRREQRAIEFFVILYNTGEPISDPDEGTLVVYHQDNAGRYTAPEYRAVTYVNISPDSISELIDVGDDRIREEYEARLNEFSVPERRVVEQLLYDDEATARAAYNRIQAGEDIVAVAEATDAINAGAILLGEVRRGDMMEELAAPVFGLSAGGLTEPLESDFGWHVMRVTEILDGGVTPLEDVREELRSQIALRISADEVWDLSNRIQDELGGGVSLESAAQNLGLRSETIAAIDAAGRNRNGDPQTQLPAARKFITEAFRADVGFDTEPIETPEGGYLILRVDSIAEPSLRPLETIRGEVLTQWRDEQRVAASLKKAEAALETLKGGKSFTALAADHAAELRKSEPFTRDGGAPDPAISIHLVARMFELNIGEHEISPTADGLGYTVARLSDISAPTGETDVVALARIRDVMAGGIMSDLIQQYQMAIEVRYPVRVNERTFAAIVASDAFLAGGGYSSVAPRNPNRAPTPPTHSGGGLTGM